MEHRTKHKLFFFFRESGYRVNRVLSSGSVENRPLCQTRCTSPSLRCSSSRQSGSDKLLTETWMLICYRWKGTELMNTWQTVEYDHPSGNIFHTSWYFCLILDLVSWVRPLFLPRILSGTFFFPDVWMSLPVMESKAFYIRPVPGDGFLIFLSLFELLPNMSNPLQACL